MKTVYWSDSSPLGWSTLFNSPISLVSHKQNSPEKRLSSNKSLKKVISEAKNIDRYCIVSRKKNKSQSISYWMKKTYRSGMVATNGDWWFTIIFMISHHYQLSMKITRLIRPWNKNYIYFRPEDGAANASGRKWQGSFRIIHLPLLFKTFTLLKIAVISQIDPDDNISINILMFWAGWGSQCNNSTVALTKHPIHYFGLKKKISL